MNLFIERGGVRLSQTVTQHWGFRLRLWADPSICPVGPKTTEGIWAKVFDLALGGWMAGPLVPAFEAQKLQRVWRGVLVEGVPQNFGLSNGKEVVFGVDPEPVVSGFPYFFSLTSPDLAQLRLPLTAEELRGMYTALVNYFELADQPADKRPSLDL